MLQKTTFTLLIFSLLFSSCREDDRQVIAQLNLDEYSTEHNLTIGDALEPEIEKIFAGKLGTTDEVAAAYLDKMLNLVVNTSAVTTREVYDYKISVINEDTRTSSFILPNGHLYIYSGLLKFLETESQFISLLAHEIYYAESGAATLLIEDSDDFEKKDLGDILLDNGRVDVAQMAAVYPTLAYQEPATEAADDFSVEVLCPFVYEPRGIVKIIQKAQSPDQTMPEWFDLRPAENMSSRVQRMNVNAEPCGLDGVKNAAEYRAFLERL